MGRYVTIIFLLIVSVSMVSAQEYHVALGGNDLPEKPSEIVDTVVVLELKK